ncbi:MAG: hypothetical protein OJF59_002334 [Cytophagales bacterium]|nr:MAG: hypothetical protein OJF59_002334 [Cytophagales bacterium]
MFFNFNFILLKFIALLPFMTVIFGSTSAQLNTSQPKSRTRGEFYFTWGYNRDWYSHSDIHIYRHDADPAKSYDFMLYHAKAQDKPDMWRWWQLDRLTIPQYDMNFGYLFNDKNDLGIEVGWNHLKYVVTPYQTIHIKGEVHGTPIDNIQPLYDTMVHIQHTNGNNYLLFSLVKRQKLIEGKHIKVSAIAKAGVGPMISYTIDTIFGDNDSGYFHYHGMVYAASVGIRANFFKHFFLQTDMQAGFANYTNTRLGHQHLGISTQHFYSFQWTYELGYSFALGKK